MLSIICYRLPPLSGTIVSVLILLPKNSQRSSIAVPEDCMEGMRIRID